MIYRKIKLLFFLFGNFFSYIIPNRIFVFYRRISNVINTGYIVKNFKYFHFTSVIEEKVVLKGEEFISIGEGCNIGKRTIISAWKYYQNQTYNPEIKIGNNVSIGNDCHITSINKIVIDNCVLIGTKVTISDNSHGDTNIETLLLPPEKRNLYSKGPVIIEKNVWVGDKVTILPNVTIGENTIIGANSVVTKSIQSNVVACGNPAIITKYLYGK